MIALTTAKADALEQLEQALACRDPDRVEHALSSVWSSGLHLGLCDVLVRLAEEPWHQRHEDVVSAIQQLRCARAVPALERVALTCHAYLSFDDRFSLARKCTWALADIGTPDAQQALQRLAKGSVPVIAGYAEKRLSRWQDELSRKSSASGRE